MNAPMYINTNIIRQHSIEHNQMIHNKKLSDIRMRKPASIVQNIKESVKASLIRNRWKSVCNCKG